MRSLSTAQALYHAVVARYSSPTTTALGCLLLPYLFPELSAFATAEDLISHLCTSDARYRATVPAEFLDRNQPPMFITLYFIVTSLTLFALSGTTFSHLTPPPSLLTYSSSTSSQLRLTSLLLRTLGQLLLERSAAVARARVAGVVEVAAVVVEVAAGVVVGAAVEVVEAMEVVAAVGLVAGVGGSSGSGGSGGGGTGGSRTGAWRGGSRGGQRQEQQRRSETQSPQQLREWLFQRGTSGDSDSCPY
ncbi:unnamed protein product, partial [Closterium sp. NIES-54]